MEQKQSNVNELTPNPKQRYQKNFTTIPKTYEQARGKNNLSSYESRVLAGIEFQDFGYPKARKAVSISWLVEFTGIPRIHVCRTIGRLIKREIVKPSGKIYENTKPAWVYEIERDYSKWVDMPQKVKGGNQYHDREKCTYLGANLFHSKAPIQVITSSPIKVPTSSPIKVRNKKQVSKKENQDAPRGGLCDPPFTQDTHIGRDGKPLASPGSGLNESEFKPKHNADQFKPNNQCATPATDGQVITPQEIETLSRALQTTMQEHSMMGPGGVKLEDARVRVKRFIERDHDTFEEVLHKVDHWDSHDWEGIFGWRDFDARFW